MRASPLRVTDGPCPCCAVAFGCVKTRRRCAQSCGFLYKASPATLSTEEVTHAISPTEAQVNMPPPSKRLSESAPPPYSESVEDVSIPSGFQTVPRSSHLLAVATRCASLSLRPPSVLSHASLPATPREISSVRCSRQIQRLSEHCVRDQPIVLRRGPTVEQASRIRTDINSYAETTEGVSHRYTFSSIDYRAMVLIPGADAPDACPLYHVSWRDNFWSPGSLITTLRRGGSAEGQFVGEFGLGVVSLDGEEQFISERMKKDSSKNMWTWTRGEVVLRWSIENAGRGRQLPWFKCQLRLTGDQHDSLNVAALRPPNYKMAVLGNLREPELKVYSVGAEIMDDIVLSGLMMQCIHRESGRSLCER